MRTVHEIERSSTNNRRQYFGNYSWPQKIEEWVRKIPDGRKNLSFAARLHCKAEHAIHFPHARIFLLDTNHCFMLFFLRLSRGIFASFLSSLSYLLRPPNNYPIVFIKIGIIHKHS